MERIEQAEQAICAAEEVITHERQNRKIISAELKQKNAELRALVEKEKKKLQDKVADELEKTLQQALKEKIQAEEALERNQRIMKERDMMSIEMDQMYLALRSEYRSTEKLTVD
jgi:paraquat-inducible protein B